MLLPFRIQIITFYNFVLQQLSSIQMIQSNNLIFNGQNAYDNFLTAVDDFTYFKVRWCFGFRDQYFYLWKQMLYGILKQMCASEHWADVPRAGEKDASTSVSLLLLAQVPR